MSNRFFFLSLFLLGSATLRAQGELNATVKINTPQLVTVDRRVFDQLEVTLRDFLNNTKWTNESFEQDERIKCSFILTISTELDNTNFQGELAVQAVRPVFGSAYETPLLSHLDKEVVFTYDQNQPIEFVLDAAENQNLAALFAFYAYVILGLDFDSFSLYGGDAYLLNAQQIVSNIQNSSTNTAPGWRPSDGAKNRNRYWIVENLLNPRAKPFRAAVYTYHRQGLDVFSADMDKAKSLVLQALEEVEKVNSAYVNSMIIQMFTNAKRDELIEMWKVAPRVQKDRVIQILSKLDPAYSQRYREIGA
jgi:hypothetical protein